MRNLHVSTKSNLLITRNYVSNASESKEKALNGNIDREEFISLLASEFYSTRNVDIQGQTSANLANLSYDPINYEFLREHCVHDIFLELIATEHTNLILHGIAGLCNLCLDDQFHQFIIENNGVELITKLLKHQDDSIKINAVACLLFLIRPTSKSLICTSSTKATIEDLCLSQNECLSKLAAYFVTDQFMDYDASDLPMSCNPPMPGPGTIVVSQSFSFPHKCVVDKEIEINVEVIERRKITNVSYDCKQDEKIVFTGTARLVTM